MRMASSLVRRRSMFGAGVISVVLVAVVAFDRPATVNAQAPPVATFKSAVDLVRVAAVVRDRKGRFIDSLNAPDFEVLDGAEARKIVDFRRESEGASIALLFDVSGSMES